MRDEFTGLIIAGTFDGAPLARRWHHSDGERLEVTQAEPSAPSEATTGNGQRSEPFMVEGSSGPHSLDQMAKLVHLACFAVRSVPNFLIDLIQKLTGQASEQRGNPR